jgi:hypothetical protein
MNGIEGQDRDQGPSEIDIEACTQDHREPSKTNGKEGKNGMFFKLPEYIFSYIWHCFIDSIRVIVDKNPCIHSSLAIAHDFGKKIKNS